MRREISQTPPSRSDHLQPVAGESAYYKDRLWSAVISFHPPSGPVPHNNTFTDLTSLVESVAHARGQSGKKDLHQIVGSATNRDDISQTTTIDLELFKQLGFDEKIYSQLQNCRNPQKASLFDLDPLRKLKDWFLLNYSLPPEEFKSALQDQIHDFGWLDQTQTTTYLLDIRQKLITLFSSRHTYLRNNTDFTNKSYLDDFGDRITLTHPIVSPRDRDRKRTDGPLQNARTITSGGRFLAATGRPDSEKKALEQAEMLIRQGLQDGTLSPKNQTFTYVINSYLNSYFEEQSGILKTEVEALKAITGQTISVDGHTFTLQPLLFNQQIQWEMNRPLAPLIPIDVTGQKATEEIEKENFPLFRNFVNEKKGALSPQEIGYIDYALQKLENDPSLLSEEVMLLRALICEFLQIPSVYHCASSKDRTSIGLAIAGGLRKWLDIHKLMGEDSFFNNEPLLLWQNESFKHLIAQELPSYHQLSRYGLGAQGTLMGKQLQDHILGFKASAIGRLQQGVLARILPSHYLKKVNPIKRAVWGIVAALTWTLSTLVAILRVVTIVPLIYNPQGTWNAVRNIWEGHPGRLVPTHELDLSGPYTKDRSLIHRGEATKPRLLLDLEKLSSQDATRLLSYLKQENPAISPEDQKIFLLIANNYAQLKKIIANRKLAKPRWLRPLVFGCRTSNLNLFKLARQYNTDFVRKIKNLRTYEPLDNFIQRQLDLGKTIERDGVYTQLSKDVGTRGLADVVEIVHNGQRTLLDMTQSGPDVLRQLKDFSFAQDGRIPLPIQALLCQTGKFAHTPFMEAISALSPGLIFEKRPGASWGISLTFLDDNTIQAKYKAPYQLKTTEGPISDLSLEFSITLQKQDGKWIELSSTIEGLRQRFTDQPFLFQTGGIAADPSKVLKEYRKGQAVEQTQAYIHDMMAVVDKNSAFYRNKIEAQFQYHRQLVSPKDHAAFVDRERVLQAESRVLEILPLWKEDRTKYRKHLNTHLLGLKALSNAAFGHLQLKEKIEVYEWNRKIVKVEAKGSPKEPYTLPHSYALQNRILVSLNELRSYNCLLESKLTPSAKKAIDERRPRCITTILKQLNELDDMSEEEAGIFLKENGIETRTSDLGQITSFFYP